MELKALGVQVAQARRALGCTQAELAVAAGLSRQTVSALERGELGDLGVRKVLRVLDALDHTLVVRRRGHRLTLDDFAAP